MDFQPGVNPWRLDAALRAGNHFAQNYARNCMFSVENLCASSAGAAACVDFELICDENSWFFDENSEISMKFVKINGRNVDENG